MLNELSTLRLNIQMQLMFNEPDSKVTIVYDEITGEYIDHEIVGDKVSRIPRSMLSQSTLHVLHKCILAELHNAVIREYNRRNV